MAIFRGRLAPLTLSLLGLGAMTPPAATGQGTPDLKPYRMTAPSPTGLKQTRMNEMMTGKVLFDAPNEVTQVTMHVSHDGSPQPMRVLMANPEVGPLAEVLVSTLRRDPRHRPTAEALRSDIRAVASMVQDAKWPVEL